MTADVNDASVDRCALCGRERRLTFHHLIPRTLHSNKWFKKNYSRAEMNEGIDVCRDCHRAIHKFIDRKELGREYNTVGKLREHPELGKFVAWIRGRNTSRIRTRRPAG